MTRTIRPRASLLAAACFSLVEFACLDGADLMGEMPPAILGTQEFAVLAPQDVLPGGITFSGAVSKVDGDGFKLRAKTSWGVYTYEVERQSEYAAESQVGPKFSQLGEAANKPVTLIGELDVVENQGQSLEGVFRFAGENVRLRLTLAEARPLADKAKPTRRNIRYGDHWRQAIDFYQAKSDRATPLWVFIHGGGWVGGDKSTVDTYGVQQYLDQGISVAAVNYRRIQDAVEFAVKPPVEYPLRDAARAIQVLRSMAAELNLDKTRFAASGGSAGACTSLWLAMRDDMANASSDDPISRESTRLTCVAVSGPQTSLDPVQLREWMPNMVYGSHAFGFWPREDRADDFQRFFEGRDQLLPQIRLYSPYEQASADDPPIFMEFRAQETPPVPGTEQRDPTHSAIAGIKLKERLDALGVASEVRVLDPVPPNHPDIAAFVIEHLKRP